MCSYWNKLILRHLFFSRWFKTGTSERDGFIKSIVTHTIVWETANEIMYIAEAKLSLKGLMIQFPLIMININGNLQILDMLYFESFILLNIRATYGSLEWVYLWYRNALLSLLWSGLFLVIYLLLASCCFYIFRWHLTKSIICVRNGGEWPKL